MTQASASPKLKTPKSAAPTKTPASAKAASAGSRATQAVMPAAQAALKARVQPVGAAAKTAPANTAPAKTEASKPAKEKKVKVVRDSFTLPKTELLQIADMKKRAMALGIEVKKSELIRAGLQAISSMADASFKKALGNVPTIKTGRPAKD